MAVTNTTKKTTRSKKSAPDDALKAALESTPVEMQPVSVLIRSPLNVRTTAYAQKSIEGLAATIQSVGVLQNLVVHALPDGLYGVAAGGRRLAALNHLLDTNAIGKTYAVPVKVVPEELAVAASMIENDMRVDMHPAEQLAGFRTLAGEGKTPAQIGDLLGYPARHVTRLLKLTTLAPALLEALAKDEISVEQCQALTLTDDHDRQLQVWTAAKQVMYHSTPSADYLKRQIINNDIAVSDPMFRFVGQEAYLSAGGTLKQDLFTDEDEGFADRLLTEKLLLEKLQDEAQHIQDIEGWAWSEGRVSSLRHYGDDDKKYQLCWPEPQYTDDERAQISELEDMVEASATYDDENELQQRIEDMEYQAIQRQVTPEYVASHGVFVSFEDGELNVQRGVLLRTEEDIQAIEAAEAARMMSYRREPEPVDDISLPLLTKMSSERTLAVQAALMQQPENAVAMLTWTLCQNVFGRQEYNNPMKVSLTCNHHSLNQNAPSGTQGKAWLALMAEKERLAGLLPAGWQSDMTTFFTLPGELMTALLAFCAACSVDGVQTRESGHTSRSRLSTLESATGFHLRDWWQPTGENFFGLLTKTQIAAALTDAGLNDAARDTEKLKRADAAARAEREMADNRWVPDWLRSPDVTADIAPDTTTQHAA
ncbi:ParB/RepB/Spo0J family partition protein [Siccibacter turicensis]|uniref:ParB/RepB/Spo0J family partition protein n=1 Tax=Siccibacter turicensis TaxID=357233 RepID=UPI0010216295|nr:ParB/RepB/Spo0J family partition protein [Siccibacter turicensis]